MLSRDKQIIRLTFRCSMLESYLTGCDLLPPHPCNRNPSLLPTLNSTTLLLHLYYNSTKIPPLPAPPYALQPALAPPGSVLPVLHLYTTMQRKSLRFPRRRTRLRTRRSPLSRPSSSVLPVLHLYYNSTKILHLPAPYAPSYAPQSALAPLRPCPPSTTFVLQCNEIPSAYRAAAVRSRAPPALSSQYYICTTIPRKSLRFPRRRTRRRTRRSPLPRPSPFRFHPHFRFHPRFVFIPVSFSPRGSDLRVSLSSPFRFHPRFVFTPRL